MLSDTPYTNLFTFWSFASRIRSLRKVVYSCPWIHVPSIPKGSLGDRRETWTVLWKTGQLSKSRSGWSSTSWWEGCLPLPFFDPFPISLPFPSPLFFPFPLPFLFHSLLSLSLSFPPVPLPLPSLSRSFPFPFHHFPSYSSLSPPLKFGKGPGERLSSPSGVRGEAPAANAFLRYFEAKNAVDGINFGLFSSTREVKFESN